MRCVATIDVDPPTLPAVCTRIIGLPCAPSASAIDSSGIITPSNGSGALPSTTASMSRHVHSASSHATVAASPPRPGSEASSRFFLCFVWPTPTTAQGCEATSVPFQHADEVLLERLARRGVCDGPVLAALGDRASGLGEPGEPDRHHRVGGERPTRRVDVDVVAETELGLQDLLLVAERRAQLGDIDLPVADARVLTREARRRRLREVAEAGLVDLDAVVEAADPHRALAHLLGLLRRRDDDRGPAVGDRREVVLAQDRKSTRLNSSHLGTSYAVFCL